MDAAWVPGWYELDQPLAVGICNEFAFWRIIPDHLRGPESLVFYNTIWRAEDIVVAIGTIRAICHPVLGEISKVDARGLDYTIFLIDGSEISVDAEEVPGKMNYKVEGRRPLPPLTEDDWRFVVIFESLSGLQPAQQFPRKRTMPFDVGPPLTPNPSPRRGEGSRSTPPAD